jgi:hypothetical protein
VAENELHWLEALAADAAGDRPAAERWLERAAAVQGDASAPIDAQAYWRALALRRLGQADEAERLLVTLLREARRRARRPARIDYFATSLPTFLLFQDDPAARDLVVARYLEGLALQGLGRTAAARRAYRDVGLQAPDHLDAALRSAELPAR